MEYDPDEEPDFRVNQSSESIGGIALVVIAVVLVVGALFYFMHNWNTAPGDLKVTQNNAALPAPIIDVPAAPAPATPPASQKVAPPADAPATSP